MVKVRVTFVGLIQRLIGSSEEVVTLPRETTLGTLLQELITRFGPELEKRLLENGDLASSVIVLVNGRNALGQGGLRAKLSDGFQSQVEIVVLGPPLMGG
ncbi:MAG: MoaD/ThiS family protein [Candidatus Binatia bacterium]